MIDRNEREMSAITDELDRVDKQLAKLETDVARNVARAVAEGRTEAEIERIRDSFGPQFNKLWKVQARLDGRISQLARLGYEVPRRR